MFGTAVDQKNFESVVAIDVNVFILTRCLFVKERSNCDYVSSTKPLSTKFEETKTYEFERYPTSSVVPIDLSKYRIPVDRTGI